jgi:hypothetical protein
MWSATMAIAECDDVLTSAEAVLRWPEALRILTAIRESPTAGQSNQLGAHAALERHAKRLATAAMVERRNAAMARKMAGEEPP